MGFTRLLGALLLLHFAGFAEVIRFANGVPEKLPNGWTVAMTHDGAPPQWEIVRDESAPNKRYVRFANASMRFSALDGLICAQNRQGPKHS
jgi:hypothetical protein